jgi:hypothetical protein
LVDFYFLKILTFNSLLISFHYQKKILTLLVSVNNFSLLPRISFTFRVSTFSLAYLHSINIVTCKKNSKTCFTWNVKIRLAKNNLSTALHVHSTEIKRDEVDNNERK